MTTIRETSTGETVGDSRFHEEFGAPSDRAVLKLKSHLTPYVREFIQNAPFAIMATADADGRCDASPKGGKPGLGARPRLRGADPRSSRTDAAPTQTSPAVVLRLLAPRSAAASNRRPVPQRRAGRCRTKRSRQKAEQESTYEKKRIQNNHYAYQYIDTQ